KDAFKTLSTDTSVLHSLVLYDSTQKEDLQQLFVLVTHKISHSREVINARQKSGYDSAAALIKQGEGMLVMDSIRNLVFKIEEKDRLLLQHSNLLRQEISENTSKRFFILAASFFLLSIVSFLLIYRRIKKGKKSETLLRYNSSLLTNIHDPIFSTDKQFNVTSWNRYAEQLYGWTEQEMKGKYFIDVLNVKYTGTTEEEVAKKYFAEGYWSGEVIHQKRNGELIYVIVSSTILKDTEGQMSGCVVVVQDITERKLKEKQIEYLASLVDQTGDAIVSFGRDTLILSWNKGAENMYGFSRDEVVGKSYPKVVRSNITPEEMNRTEKTLLEKGSWQGENIHYRKDGTSFYCLASATVVRDKDGAVNECVMIVRDITERKKLETQILSFNKELQQQVVEK
ncbi:MAG: PAS domain S-box protein, partial [Bacteroidetes bacterium]|nr:PAS domain S-box protein [Bacteroidota bacterium]